MPHDAESSISDLARSNPILGRLTSAAAARLIQASHVVDVSSGEVLIRQGDQSDFAYLLLQGELDICVETAYGEVLLARVPPGALIGEIGVFAELSRTATVRAPVPARVLCLNRTDLLKAGDLEPDLLRSIIGRLGAQIASFNHAIGLYTNAVSALEREDFALSILDQLRQPIPELLNFEHSFRRMAEQIVRQRTQQAEMASAAAIQRAMLPKVFPTSLVDGRFTIHAEMKPAREVGGDLYDILPLDADRSVIVIGDVCGKGVPASLFMAVTQTVMRLVVRSGTDLGAEIRAANELLVANNELTMFATLFCGMLDARSGILTYCNCGHNPPLLLNPAGTIKRLTVQGPPLGIQEGIKYAPQSITLEPGDLLFLYTDGVTEAENSENSEFFGNTRLEEAIRELREPSARKVVENVMMRVTEFANGAPQSDDITCVALLRDHE